MQKEVKVYTLSTWPHCTRAKEYLSQKGVTYRAFDVANDAAAAKEMIKVSGARSVPVITVGDEVIVGFDSARLDAALSS